MLKKYEIIYKTAMGFRKTEIEAGSKYAAKQLFYRKYPRYEIVKVEEVREDEG